jgi:hypothetical protein
MDPTPGLPTTLKDTVATTGTSGGIGTGAGGGIGNGASGGTRTRGGGGGTSGAGGTATAVAAAASAAAATAAVGTADEADDRGDVQVVVDGTCCHHGDAIVVKQLEFRPAVVGP